VGAAAVPAVVVMAEAAGVAVPVAAVVAGKMIKKKSYE
jgi:hypothetical protein